MSLSFRRTVAGRAGLRRNACAAATTPASIRHISSTATVKSGGETEPQPAATGVSYDEMRYGNPLALPRLPIPKLEDTVARYLQVRIEKQRG